MEGGLIVRGARKFSYVNGFGKPLIYPMRAGAAYPYVSLLFLLLQLSFVSASPVGFEYLGGVANTTHVWNQGSPKSDWYFGGLSTFQLSNFPGEKWETVLYGLSWGDSVEEVLANYVEVSGGGAGRVDRSDNLTFVNVTAWRDMFIGGKRVRLAKSNFIGVNDSFMQQWFYAKAFENINVPVWFVIHRTELTLPIVQGVYVNGSEFYFNSSVNVTLVLDGSMVNKTFFFVESDGNRNIVFEHFFPNSDWKLVFHSGSVYFVFKAGMFAVNQEKMFKTLWQDSDLCSCGVGFEYAVVTKQIMDMDGNSQASWVLGEPYQYNHRVVEVGGACTADTLINQWYNGSAWRNVGNGSAQKIRCLKGATCQTQNAASGVFYNKNQTGTSVGKWNTRVRWWCSDVEEFSAEEVVKVYFPPLLSFDLLPDAGCVNRWLVVSANYSSNISNELVGFDVSFFVNGVIDRYFEHGGFLFLSFNNSNVSFDSERPVGAVGGGYVGCPFGGCLLLNWTEHFNYSTVNNLNFSNGTISFWLSHNTPLSKDSYFLLYEADDMNYFNVSFYKVGSSLVQVIVYYKGNGTVRPTVVNNLVPNVWARHDLVFEQGKNLYYYVNGVLVGTSIGVLPWFNMTGSNSFSLGFGENPVGTSFNVSRFRTFDSSMSGEAVRWLYASNLSSHVELWFNVSNWGYEPGDVVVGELSVIDNLSIRSELNSSSVSMCGGVVSQQGFGWCRWAYGCLFGSLFV